MGKFKLRDLTMKSKVVVSRSSSDLHASDTRNFCMALLQSCQMILDFFIAGRMWTPVWVWTVAFGVNKKRNVSRTRNFSSWTDMGHVACFTVKSEPVFLLSRTELKLVESRCNNTVMGIRRVADSIFSRSEPLHGDFQYCQNWHGLGNDSWLVFCIRHKK